MAPSISVVIPTLNEATRLPTLLDRLDRQTRRPDEIVVADADSRDGTASIASGAGARVVRGGSPSQGRNAGAAAARGDLILFLDADVEPDDAFIASAVAEFIQRGLAAAAAPMRPVEPRLEYSVACVACNTYNRALERLSPHAPGFCILVRREVHEAIGGFDETAVMAEDHDYVRRASQHGRFAMLRSASIRVSMRRVELEGRLVLAREYLYAELRHLRQKPVTSAPFGYPFGEHVEAKPDVPGGAGALGRLAPVRQRCACTLRTLKRPSTERQNDAIGLQLLSAVGGGALVGCLAIAGSGPAVWVPVACAAGTVTGLSTLVAVSKLLFERRYGQFLIASPVTASYDVVDGDGRVLARRGMDEVCELHVIGHLLRMSLLSRRGAQGRLLILLEAMHGLEAVLDDLDDPLYKRTNVITARSDLVSILFKMGFEEMEQPPPFDLANRLNKYCLMRLLTVMTGHDRTADLRSYRLAAMTRSAFASEAFRGEVSRQIRRIEGDLARLRGLESAARGAVAGP